MAGVRSIGFVSDAAMPAVSEMLDLGSMRAVFIRHLWKAPAIVDSCEVERLRYREGQRCIVRYVVRVREHAAAVPVERWVTATSFGAPGRAQRRVRKGRSAVFVPELDLTLDVFPHDSKLPSAAAAIAGTEPELRRAVTNAFGPGEWTLDAWEVEPVRYRERLSLVVRYRVRATDASGTSTGLAFYLKAYPTLDDATSAYAHMEALSAHDAVRQGALHIAPAAAVIDSLSAVLTPSAIGRPLALIVDTGTPTEQAVAMRQSAAALASFSLGGAPIARRVTTVDYARSLDRPSSTLVWASSSLAPVISRVREVVSRLGEPDVLRPTHRDMKVEHVLIDGPDVTFIDLDSAALADPVMDVALLSARLFALGVRGHISKRRAATLVETFADEYFARVPREWQRRMPAYYAGSLVEVAASLVYRQAEGWRQHVGVLLDEAIAATA
jgi:hypothetical protein